MAAPLLTTIVGLLCTSISSFITFMITKKKYNAEVDAQQIENINKSFNVYKKMMDESILIQDKKISQLQKENDDLKKEISNLQLQVAQLLNSVCNDTSCRLRRGFSVNNK